MLSANTDRSVKLETIRSAKKVSEDREAAEQRRQQRGDERAEEQQREQEDDREREQLGAREVVADLRVDLRVRDRAAAELDVTLAGELAPPGAWRRLGFSRSDFGWKYATT